MDADRLLSVCPAAQVSDSLLRRWPLGEGGGQKDVFSVSSYGSAPFFESRSSWGSGGPLSSGSCQPATHLPFGQELVLPLDCMIDFHGGSQVPTELCTLQGQERVQVAVQTPAPEGEQQYLFSKGRQIYQGPGLDFNPLGSSIFGDPYSAATISQSHAVSGISPSLPPVFRSQMQKSRISKLPSVSAESCCGLPSWSSDHQLPSPMDRTSPDCVMVSSEVYRPPFECNFGKTASDGIPATCWNIQSPAQECLMDWHSPVSDVASRKSGTVFYGGYSAEGEKDLKLWAAPLRMQPHRVYMASHPVVGSFNTKPPILASGDRNLALAPIHRRRLKAPHKVFSPSSVRKISGSRSYRQSSSIWRPGVAPVLRNNHLGGSNRGIDQNGRSQAGTLVSDYASDMQQVISDLLMESGVVPGNLSPHVATSPGNLSPHVATSPGNLSPHVATSPGKCFSSRSKEAMELVSLQPVRLLDDGCATSRVTGDAAACVEPSIPVYDLLKRVVEALDLGNMDDAQAILARLSLQLEESSQLSCKKDFFIKTAPVRPLQDRVAFLFKEALTTRLSGRPSVMQECSPLDVFNSVSALKQFCEVSPVLNFAHFSANQAILESMEGEETFHVIDFGVASSGTQWASLLYDLAYRAGTTSTDIDSGSTITNPKPKLRLTMVGMSREKMECIGDSLRRFAQDLNVELNFHPIVVEQFACLELTMLPHVDDNEPVAVNIVFGLQHLCADSPIMSSCFPILKRMVSVFLPKVVTVVEKNFGVDSPTFQDRFSEALHHYTLLFHSIETSICQGDGRLHAVTQGELLDEVLASGQVVQENFIIKQIASEEHSDQHRKCNEAIEMFLFGSEIENTIQLQGHEMVGIYEVTHQWRRRLEGSGLRPRHLSGQTEKEAECLLRNFAGQGFAVSNKEGSLLLAWQGYPLVASTAWVCL